MKKSLKILLPVLMIPCMLSIASCDQNVVDSIPNSDTIVSNMDALKEVAGKYSSLNYSSNTKQEIIFEIKETGAFTFGSIENDGIKTEESFVDGFLTVDENKNITSVVLGDFNALINGGKLTFLGNEIEISSSYMSASMTYEVELFKQMFTEIIKSGVKISDNYMTIISQSEPLIFYKEGATKLAENSNVLFMTRKEAYEIYKAYSMFSSREMPEYEYDMYLLQNKEYDGTNTEHVKALNEEVSDYCAVFTTDKFGELAHPSFENLITKVENVEVKTLNTGTAKVTYKLGEKEYSENVTYKVVASEDEYPDNALTYLASNESKILYVEKGSDILTKNYKLKYRTYQSSSNSTIDINTTNCTGENAKITMTGYDATKTGYQVITFTYRGMSCKQAIFVYDETHNPLNSISTYGCVYLRTEEGVSSFDLSSISFTLNYVSGKSETKTYEDIKDSVTLLSELTADKYEDGDSLVIKYTYTYDGKTYYFYNEVYFYTEVE